MKRDVEEMLGIRRGASPAKPQRSALPRSPAQARTRRRRIATLLIGAAALLGIFLLTPAGAELEWLLATSKHESGSYRRFADEYPTSRHAEDAAWRWASMLDDSKSFEAYLSEWPEGVHAAEGRRRDDDLLWTAAKKQDSIDALSTYASRAPPGAHVSEARERVDAIEWDAAHAVDTVRSYEAYLVAHPDGAHVGEAHERNAALRDDPALFDAAVKQSTEDSLQTFLRDFPGHTKEEEARHALADLTEGRDIVDLIADGTIEVRANGQGIQSVAVEMRRRVPRALRVRVPVGTFFDSAAASAQNMVSTATDSIVLADDEWQTLDIAAACANRPLHIPGGEDRFAVRRSSQQKELTSLVAELEKARVSYATSQAAVWVVTDDASYDDLGILVNGPFGGRVIHEPEAGRALQILQSAGIDVSRKRLWRDRATILMGLPDGEVKDWLQQAELAPH